MKISNKIKTFAAGGASVVAAGLNACAASAVQVRCPDGSKAENLENCKGIKGDGNKDDLMTTLSTIINVIIRPYFNFRQIIQGSPERGSFCGIF